MNLALAAAATNGLLAVAVGAFGAHGMSDPQAKAWVATGSTYQLAHAAAALGLVALGLRGPSLLLSLGALLFALALYVLAFSGQRWLGMIAPVGGLLMIAGWLWALVATFRT